MIDWISVEERLPDKTKRAKNEIWVPLLIAVDLHGLRLFYSGFYGAKHASHSKRWYAKTLDGWEELIQPVTHWAEINEPSDAKHETT
jgi:hypothetical protein